MLSHALKPLELMEVLTSLDRWHAFQLRTGIFGEPLSARGRIAPDVRPQRQEPHWESVELQKLACSLFVLQPFISRPCL